MKRDATHPVSQTERSEAEGWGSLGGGTCRFSLEPPSFRRGPVRGPDENGDASPTRLWRSMRWLVPERFRRQGRMWYIQPHSTASLRPSEGAGHRGRAECDIRCVLMSQCIAGAMLRLRCSRLPQGFRLDRRTLVRQGRYFACACTCKVKGRYESAQACSLPVQHF